MPSGSSPALDERPRAPPDAARRLPAAASPALHQLVGALLEHTQDRLPVGDVERDDPGLAVVGAFEPLGGVDELGLAKAGGELEDDLVGDRKHRGGKMLVQRGAPTLFIQSV